MLELDHIVYATPDLAATVAWFESPTGVRPTPGGRHVGFSTRNELVALGPSSYLEIVGPDLAQDAPEHARPFGIDELPSARYGDRHVSGEARRFAARVVADHSDVA